MLSVKIRKQFGAAREAVMHPHAGGISPSNFLLDAVFDAPPGVTILFGASGSGKTTTLKIIAGLIRPDTGEVSVGGRVLFNSDRNINLPIRARRVGYVFQNAALFPHLSALANVEFAVAKSGRSAKLRRAQDFLEQFGIPHVARRLPRDISGGEAQRVALARALASMPEMLLLDEPLSALDEATKLGIIADLRKINRELSLPILYVTHSQDEAYAIGERAVVYEHGRVVAAGSPDEVFGSPVKASVARLTGVENIFEGIIEQRCDETGTTVVRLAQASDGDCRVEVPLSPHAVGEAVRVAVRAGDILLATERPRGISARNVLGGQVLSVEDRGDRMHARVRSGVEWVASLTRMSAREMQLRAGQEIWLAFKTHSCRVLED